MAEQAVKQFVSLRAVQAGNVQFKHSTTVTSSGVSIRAASTKPSQVTVTAVSQASRVPLPTRK